MPDPTISTSPAAAPSAARWSLAALLLALLVGAVAAAPSRAAEQEPMPLPRPEASDERWDEPAPEAPEEAREGAARALERIPAMPLEEIHRGQKGYGLTVFTGLEPERFEMEILGVMRNNDPATDYVLARLSGRGLETIGVASGMSGSPVYIDGRLVGAVAFAWPYAKEAIAGITPIGGMRALADLPTGAELPRQGPPPRLLAAGDPAADLLPAAPTGESRAPGPAEALVEAPTLEQILAGQVPADFAVRQMARLVAPSGRLPAPGAQRAVAWGAGGFGEVGQQLLDSAFGAPVTRLGSLPAAGMASSGAASGASSDPWQGRGLVDGGPVAAVLVAGDLQLAAYGTITERSDDEILAFGHSFLGVGPANIPLAEAEILTVLSSSQTSFKISNLGPIVGAFQQDHRLGIRGLMGASAPTIPMTVRIEGLSRRDLSMELADLRTLTPALVASGVFGSLDLTTFTNAPQGLELDATIRLADHEPLRVVQSFDGVDAAGAAVNHLVAMVSYLLANDLEPVTMEGIEVTLHQTTGRRAAEVVAGFAERPVVHPGEELPIHLSLRSWRGQIHRHTMTVQIPEDLPAGRLSLLVGDGESADAVRLSLEPTDPTTLDEALELLGSYRSRRELVVLQAVPDRGLATAGSALPRLPASMESLWDGRLATDEATPLTLALVAESSEETSVPLEGMVRIDLEIEPLHRVQPVAGEDDDSGAALRRRLRARAAARRGL